ncbi:sulfatase [Halorarum salinum]|uniref:Sulfatase n=1 Tax=Halorarum salinum TaxID=2743089 RepID=A0A7D5L947_9EURY|nr:sulfatase [Halobaculum salinum]QLG61226.1 sulfatase [Halobaculum salinum]
MNDTTPEVENVLLVTVDSLRADALGGARTPVVDELAAGGTTFENAFATGNWTPFSFPGILTSRPVFAEGPDIGTPSTPTLAEALADAGVRTGGYNAANGFLTEHWGYDRGFDEFESFVGDASSRYSRYLAAHPTVQGWLQLLRSPFRRAAAKLSRSDDGRPFADTSKMLDVERGAISFLEGADGPFFLWVHYMDPHTPYVPAPRYLRQVSSDRLGTGRMLRAHVRTGLGRAVGPRTLADLRTLYHGGVRQVDASLGRLREALARAGHADDTAVVFAGDHGEEFQEHGHLAHYPKLYDELIHVPFVVDVPGAESRTVERAVGLDAVPPTVASLLDVSGPDAWEGEDLSGVVLEGRTDPGAAVNGTGATRDGSDGGAGADAAGEPVVSVAVRGEDVTQQPIPRSLAEGDLLVSARTAGWVYVENTETGVAELYDREADPEQGRDLLAEPDADRPEVLTELRGAVREHADRIGGDGGRDGGEPRAGSEGGEEDLDSAIADRLDALGYR